ncbi:MAG: beta-lactamase family protein [Flavobacteriaceae bacterium]|nr:beta-lactamase family protein [Flavobacteriaceae bacterium]
MTIQRIFLVILLIATAKVHAQAIGASEKETIQNILKEYKDGNAPGVAVGIVKNGAIVFEDFIGNANLDNATKINRDTRFNIASNAKQFTAFCILKLSEEGSLSLKDDIRKYLPELYKNIEDPITVADLLAHTSGIRDVYALWSLKGLTWWQLFIGNNDAMDLIKSQNALNFKPGTDYVYSNSNYILLTEIIKKVTGEEFSDYAKSTFVNLGMPNTEFLTNYMAVIPNKARPYGNWGSWIEYPMITEIHGDGALFTSLGDQLKWEQILQHNDGQHNSEKLINQSQAPLAFDYGYGLMFGNSEGLKYTYHDGNTGAYNATFLRFPSEKTAVVVMSNNANISTNNLAWQMAQLVLNRKDNPTAYPGNPDKIEDLTSLQEVLGNYRNEQGTIIRITEIDGSIYREMYQRDPVKLINEEGALFEYETIEGLKMNFTNIGTSDQRFTLYLSSQRPNTFYKIGNSNLGNYDKNALNGSFYNNETDTKFQIKYIDNATYSIQASGWEGKAELILKDYLRFDSYEIDVLRDQENKVVGLRVHNNRLRNVIFNRS